MPDYYRERIGVRKSEAIIDRKELETREAKAAAEEWARVKVRDAAWAEADAKSDAEARDEARAEAAQALAWAAIAAIAAMVALAAVAAVAA